MKNKVYLFASVLFLSLVLVSCSSIEEGLDDANVKFTSVEAHPANNLSELKAQMITSREQINFTSQKKAKGFLGRIFERVIKVIGADCVGAVSAAIQGTNVLQSAKTSSKKAFDKQSFITCIDAFNTFVIPPVGNKPNRIQRNSTSMTDFLYPKDYALSSIIIIPEGTVATFEDSIGYYHNKMLYDLIEEHPDIDFWRNISDEELCILIEESTKMLPNIEKYYNVDTSYVKENVQLCGLIDRCMETCTTFSDFINYIESIDKELSELVDVISVYLDNINICNSDEDWEEYSRYVIKLIDASNIDAKYKNSLRLGVQVGFASSRLWYLE